MIWTLTLAAALATPLIEPGATWSYLDDGVEQANWQTPTFDDSAWTQGPAPLGYGDPHIETVVSFGPDASTKHTTTWFRHHFDVTAVQGGSLKLRIMRDDAAVAYLNGVEVARSNIVSPSTAATLASGTASGAEETTFFEFVVDPTLVVLGDNVLAIEVHQRSPTSSDLGFDVQLDWDTGVIRGPYLQRPTTDSIIVRWRTLTPTATELRVGEVVGQWTTVISDPTPTTEHQVEVTGLMADRRYAYAIADANGILAGGDAGHSFSTLPETDRPIRLWVLGDSGTGNNNARAVRDGFWAHNRDHLVDGILMLGDNAYNSGTDLEYQQAVFDIYDDSLRQLPLWSTLGNHDGYSADSASQTGPYYDIFNLPSMGEAGGEPSGTEAYYSFDIGDTHFLCLDSYESDTAPGSAQHDWMIDDLARTDATWVIAYWHHPPYTKGSHDSDLEGALIDIRQHVLPALEAGGVDLVLSGHSHAYERSMLIDGHHGPSSTFDASMILDDGDGDRRGEGAYRKPSVRPEGHEGTVYVVAGSSGKLSSAGALDHPVMELSLRMFGSMVLDIDGRTLSATFLDQTGTVQDRFQIRKGLELAVGAAWSGQAVRMSVAGARPGDSVVFGVSGDTGSGPCPPSLDGLCLGLRAPILLGTATANSEGLAVLVADVPPNVPNGSTVGVQAAILNTGGARPTTSEVREVVLGTPPCPPGGVPVCTVIGNTYPSACEAEFAGYPVLFEGTCPP